MSNLLSDDEVDELVWQVIEAPGVDMRNWQAGARDHSLSYWQDVVGNEFPDLSKAERDRVAKRVWHRAES